MQPEVCVLPGLNRNYDLKLVPVKGTLSELGVSARKGPRQSALGIY